MLFEFHENPAVLAVLHAGWSNIRVLAHEPQVRVGGETWVEHTTAGFLPVVLGFRHTVFEPPFRFGEELIHGPFLEFSHIHEFVAQEDKTLLRDLVRIRLPRQYGGEWVMKNVMARLIERGFYRRGEAIKRLAQDRTVERLAAQHRHTRS